MGSRPRGEDGIPGELEDEDGEMSKTTKPLTICVDPTLIGKFDQAFGELQAKGHTIVYGGLPWEADLILGPTCARFIPGMEKFLESFIKGARAVRYKKGD